MNRNLMVAVCACVVLVIGMVASVNLAVPLFASGSLHPSASGVVWTVDTYIVFFACLVVPGGAAGDRFGRKGVLLSGLIMFAIGALISAVAPDMPVMYLGRAITGVGAAGVLPNTLAVLLHVVPAERRAPTIAVWASMTGIGGVVGNVVGGVVLTGGSWRWLFASVIPIAALLFVAVARFVPVSARHDRPLDPIGAVLLVLATVALLVGIIQGPQDGWGSATVIAGFVASAALFTAWTLSELRSEHPLLDPRLFAIPQLRSACLGMITVFFGMFGLFYLNASFLQYAKNFGVLQTGVGIVPLTIPVILGTRYVGRISARIGRHATIAIAFALIGGGLLGLSTSTGSTDYFAYAGWLVVMGGGVMLALPSLSADIATALPPAQAGVGAGLQATTREFGSALGVAVIGTILTARFVSHLPAALLHGGSTPKTVAAALAIGGQAHHAGVLTAFTSGADAGMRAVGIVVLVVGALVTAQAAFGTAFAAKVLDGRVRSGGRLRYR